MEKLISYLKNLHVSDKKMVEKYRLSSRQPIGQIGRLPQGRAIQLTFGRRGSPREGLKHIKQLKIRYGVHVHVLVHVSLRLTARVPKWVFDPSTAGIFTQEIGNDASELLFMERSGSAHFGREGKRKKWRQECGDKDAV